MAKVKETKAAEAKPEQLTIHVNKQEFIRTRDALITSWLSLEGALRDATRAYISHSNAVLGGNENLDLSKLDLTTFLAGQFPPIAEPKEEGEEVKVKQKRTRKPKDPNAPKRPLTAYLAWLGDNRQKIHAELGSGQGRGGISSEGTKRWHALPEETKQDYKNKYEKETEKYKEELAAYKASTGGVLPAEAEDDEDVPETAEAEPVEAVAGAESDASSDSDSDSDSDSEPPKEPTPPPAKTPRSAKKASAKKATVPASSPPPPASSPAKAFTAVNGAANGKRKNAAKAEPAEEPKKKRTRKEVAKEEAPASAPTETPTTGKRERKKSRKSAAGDA